MTKCQCTQADYICTETDVEDIIGDGKHVCGCCLANCPDVHLDHETNDHPINRSLEKNKKND